MEKGPVENSGRKVRRGENGMGKDGRETMDALVTGQAAREVDGAQENHHGVIFRKRTTGSGIERTKIETAIGAITHIVSMEADGARTFSRIMEMGRRAR